MNKSVLRYFLVVALLLGLLIAPLSTVRAQTPSVWDGTYPATRPAGMDDGAGDLTIDIYTAEEFAWIMSQPNMFLDGVAGVHTVRLNTDIDLANYPWTPSVAAGSTKSNTFDGGGHTISNLFVDGGTYQSSNTRYFLGLFGRVPGAHHAKIQNLTVDGAVLNGSTTVRSYAGVITGSEDWEGDYENVHVRNATITASKYVGAIAAYGGSNMTNVSAENITFNVTEIGSDKPHVGGLIGLNNYGTLENATVTNLTLNITADDGNLETDQVGTLIGTAQAPVVINPNSTATNVTYNGAPYTNIVGLDNRKDTNWYDPAGDNYVITTIEQLLGLDSLLNAGTTFLGKTILLGKDINLYGQSFFPLGGTAEANRFQGTFNGQNHTLSNLSLTQASDHAGFFARIDEGGVRNLNIDGFYVKAPQYAGAVAGQMFRASFENVHVSNTTILSDHYGGGVTGHLYGNAKNSSATNVTVQAHNEVPGELGNKLGGLAGYVGEGAYVLENNTGTNVTVIGLRDVGGLFGTTLYGNKVYSNTITNSTVTASNAEGSHADPWAGGIVGRLGGQFTTFRGNVNDNTTVTSYVAEHAGPIYGGPVANANDERVYNQTQQIWHPSISAAILAANDNDALFASPGIYPENIVINKKITLNGPDVDSAFGATPATVQGTITINSSDVTINDLKVVPGTVNGNGAGIHVYAGNVALNRNLIDGLNGDGNGTVKGIHVYSASGIANITLDHNLVKNINNTGSGSSGIMIQGIVDTVTISNNTVEAVYSGGWAYGIEVTPTSNPANAIPQNVSITGNTIINITAPIGGVGLSIDRVNANYTADASQVTVNNNKFLGPVNNYAIVNKDPNHTLNATSNFYGVNVKPEDVILHHPETIGDIQLGPVQYIPFYGDEEMNELVNETSLNISPALTEACGTESEMIIAVNVGAVNYTNGYQMDIQYNNTEIEITDAYNGDVFTAPLLEAEGINTVGEISTLSYGNSTVGTGGVFRHIKDDDGGVLMYLKVKRLTPGNSTLTLLPEFLILVP